MLSSLVMDVSCILSTFMVQLRLKAQSAQLLDLPLQWHFLSQEMDMQSFQKH